MPTTIFRSDLEEPYVYAGIKTTDRWTGEEHHWYPAFDANNPCPICHKPTGNRKQSYCLVREDRRYILCGHATSGGRPLGHAGRVFPVTGDYIYEVDRGFDGHRLNKTRDRPNLDWAGICRRAYAVGRTDRVRTLAMELGVSLKSLLSIGCGWIHSKTAYRHGTLIHGDGAWTFPMFDADGKIIGVRLRTADKKFCMSGSTTGLFRQTPIASTRPNQAVFAVEGPTDLAAMLDLGLPCIGRPAARGCIDMILRVMRPCVPIIVADRDDAGIAAADDTVATLRDNGVPAVRIEPPRGAKDARNAALDGATREEWIGLAREAIRSWRVRRS